MSSLAIPALVPENAPFSETQRMWLNGFIAGLLGMEHALAAATSSGLPAAAGALAEADDFPWHDPTLPLTERIQLAVGRPLAARLMAAMGQLDCGQCGYDCRAYGAAIADGRESDPGKCVPGGRDTAKRIRLLLQERGTIEAIATTPVPVPQRGYGRDVAVIARMKSSVPLSAAEAEKATHHIAIDLGDTGLAYEPGDSLGVWPHNNPDEVELLLAILKARGSEAVTLCDGAVVSAREALTRECDLRAPGDTLYRCLAGEAKDSVDRARLARLADDDSEADAFGVHDVLDVLMEFPSARPRVGDFVAALSRLQPRLYSIASSQRMHPAEAHLTIGVLRYDRNDRTYQGTASGFLADALRPGRPLSVFVQRSHGFRLPADPATPVIMIGPGTGIAPFRAFLQERAASGAPGRNWLLFGNQRRDQDFLYRDELESLAERRVLSRLDLAFSRDQASKVYVQHRMLEAAAELWRWLRNGAHLYVCGDAKRMAGDVDLALRQIASTEGAMDDVAARRWLADLARAGRYLRDVY